MISAIRFCELEFCSGLRARLLKMVDWCWRLTTRVPYATCESLGLQATTFASKYSLRIFLFFTFYWILALLKYNNFWEWQKCFWYTIQNPIFTFFLFVLCQINVMNQRTYVYNSVGFGMISCWAFILFREQKMIFWWVSGR